MTWVTFTVNELAELCMEEMHLRKLRLENRTTEESHHLMDGQEASKPPVTHPTGAEVELFTSPSLEIQRRRQGSAIYSSSIPSRFTSLAIPCPTST